VHQKIDDADGVPDTPELSTVETGKLVAELSRRVNCMLVIFETVKADVFFFKKGSSAHLAGIRQLLDLALAGQLPTQEIGKGEI
jgi:hypothetical protein